MGDYANIGEGTFTVLNLWESLDTASGAKQANVSRLDRHRQGLRELRELRELSNTRSDLHATAGFRSLSLWINYK